MELQRRIERRALAAIGDQLDRPEQAAPADITDMPVIAEALGQATLELTAASFTLSSRSLVAHHVAAPPAPRRMPSDAQIGMAVL